MTGSAGVTLLAADGAGLVEKWRDLGPTLWLVAGALAGAWVLVLGLLAARSDPRRVRPGAATLEVQGTETPAVVNLVTTDWDLGHEAIPATLIDLAARRYLTIDLLGGRTFVHVRTNRMARPGEPPLTRYEEMVLDHVRSLARQTDDGRVPGEALTTGPDATAKNWWKQFRSSVVDDARARRLSRARWSGTAKALLTVAAVPVAVALALAVSTLPDDPDDPDDDPVTGAFWAGIVTFGGLSAVAGTRSGERDTPEGREAAARWLGLRELLEEDPLFAEQPPAAVAIWDHLLAQGTALGVAHGVVQALPLGAESAREAWSSVGGRWRVVRIRYPRYLPPGYGRHPALVVLLGVVHLVLGVPLLPLAQSAATALRDSFDDGGPLGDGSVGVEVPAGVEVAIPIVLAVVTVAAAGVALRGAVMTLVGLADLVGGRAEVEGRVLRQRTIRNDDKVVSWLAVDDGTAERVRAWRFGTAVGPRPGQTVRARVTGRLRHVTELEVVRGPGETADPATAAADPTVGGTAFDQAVSAAEGITGAIVASSLLHGATPAGAAPAGGGQAGGSGDGDGSATGAPPPPPPPLPGDDAVSAAAGRPLTRDSGAAAHPAALAGGSALYREPTGGHVQVVWVPAATIDVYRRLPSLLRHEVPGLGDEGYRARFGGGVMARRDTHVVMVTPHLPGLGSRERDDIAVRVAGAALAASGVGPGPQPAEPAPGAPSDR